MKNDDSKCRYPLTCGLYYGLGCDEHGKLSRPFEGTLTCKFYLPTKQPTKPKRAKT